MFSPIRRCSLKIKAIATGSDSESNGSLLVRGPRVITLRGMDNPRPTNADLAVLDDSERDVVRFSLELEDREATGHVPADDVEQENEPKPVQIVTPSADVDSANKDKTSAEKEISFAFADFLPIRWTGTDFEFDEEIDPEQELIFQTNPHVGFSFLIPAEHQRPWTPPAGYACVYESWFNNCSLWWPLPEFMTTYCSRRKIALGQYTANGIRIMVTLTVLAAELGITMLVFLFEELTTPSITAKTGFFYGKMIPKYNVITVKPSKVNFWNHRYFYVKINEESFEDPSIILNGYFNANIGMISSRVTALLLIYFIYFLFVADRLGKWSQGGSQSFLEEVKAIRTLSHQHWPDINKARIQAALNRINRVEIDQEISSRSRRQRMGKLNLASLPSYADMIGTPVHGHGSSGDSRPAKRRRESNVDEGAPHVSDDYQNPLLDPVVEVEAVTATEMPTEEHFGDDDQNPLLDPVVEAEAVTTTEIPTEEHLVDPSIKVELQGDQFQEPAPAALGGEVVEYPHVINFRYQSTDVPFVEDHEAPARLFFQIKLKRIGMPELIQLYQDSRYQEMTRAGAIFFGNANLMVRDYEAKLRAQDASLAAKTVAEKDEAAEKAEIERSHSELLSKELEELKAEKELLDSRCLNLEQEKSEIVLNFETTTRRLRESREHEVRKERLRVESTLRQQVMPVYKKARADEVQLLEELQGMEVVDASEINLVLIGLDEHGSNMTTFSPQDIEDLRT
ncbi:hypothetical protein N665_0339s0084 [Sinapis alba]|nr:hypothetical protein N665_0339s0084 [Sinapis alba]